MEIEIQNNSLREKVRLGLKTCEGTQGESMVVINKDFF
jgi:hypothetical protein